MKPAANKGRVIVIVAPSGTGKSTLIKRLFTDFPNLRWSVSYTTRKPREGERNGRDYFFVSQEDFESMRKQGEFLEYAQVHGNSYGTSKRFVQGSLDIGTQLLFDLDIQGADAFKDFFKDKAKVIFIAPPSLTELETRLRKRGTENEHDVKVRLDNAKREIGRKDDYDYCVINDDVNRAYDELHKIFTDLLN